MNLLFDLDGTLTDPGEGFVACVAHALAALGCAPLADAEIRRHVGPPLEETLARLLGAGDARIPAAVALYRERYAREGWLQNRIYPGIEAALDGLAARGATLFVATSKPLVFAERILEHFGLRGRFRAVYGSGLDGTYADKAKLIAHIASVHSLSATATTMIGDRAHDIAGAAANGLAAIGVLWGYGSRAELLQAGARAVCEHPRELAALLAISDDSVR